MRCYRSQSLGNGEFNDSLSIMVTNRSIMFRNRFTGFKIVARFNILSQYTSRRHGRLQNCSQKSPGTIGIKRQGQVQPARQTTLVTLFRHISWNCRINEDVRLNNKFKCNRPRWIGYTDRETVGRLNRLTQPVLFMLIT